MQFEKVRNFIIILVVVIAIPAGLIYASKQKEIREAQERDYEFSTAREEFKATVENPEFYTNANNTYVKSVDAVLKYESGELGSYITMQINTEHVKVYLDDEIDGFDERLKCEMFASIAADYMDRLNHAYWDSRYLKLFKEWKGGGDTIEYDGKEVMPDHHCYFENFTFATNNRLYSLDYKSTYDGRYLLTDKTIKDDSVDFYVFYYNEGQVTGFQSQSKWQEQTKGTSKKTSTSSSSSKSSGAGKSKSGTKKTYDPYNVHDYKSAQDFTDDKYEEFYDYEDDYEDEDEAYDAAEDYWNDHH